MRSRFDLAAVEPLPDVEISLTGFDVSVERSVIPEEDLCGAAVFAPFILPGGADADARVDACADRVQDQQHLALRERNVRVVVRLDERRVGKGVAAAERRCNFPAAAGLRRA